LGPIALFDKSFIQSLTVDESVWFDVFFITNVCPIFYIETLADLRKTGLKGRNAADEVRIIANKFPQLSSAPSSHHLDMCLTNLLGYEVVVTGQIPLANARLVDVGGEIGVVSEESPVAAAFSRWQEGKFLEVELSFAKAWRDALSNLNLINAKAILGALGIDPIACKTLEEARILGDNFVLTSLLPDESVIYIENLLGIPANSYPSILKRYIEAGRPALRDFAPYAAFILEVEIFFLAAFASSLISTKTPSNRVDSAYLFYLPFCMGFVSSDKFHRRSAPYFLRSNQDFLWGPDLKEALRWLNVHYSAYPEEEKAKGVVAFAQSLPNGAPEILTQLWDRHLPGWRNWSSGGSTPKSRSIDDVVDKFKQMDMSQSIHPDAQTFRTADISSATIKRRVSRRRGSWRLVPQDLSKEQESSSI
jgi:hypothetical protein